MQKDDSKDHYAVCSWDPLLYRMFHPVIELFRGMNLNQRLPKVSALPAVLITGLLSLIAIDAVTHKSEDYDWRNHGSQAEQYADPSDVSGSSIGLSGLIQLFESFRQNPSQSSTSQILAKSTVDNSVISVWPTQLLEDRINVDALVKDYDNNAGVFKVEQQTIIDMVSEQWQDGMLLYIPDVAKETLDKAGVNRLDTLMYKGMDPKIVAIVHTIPGLPKHIVDDFPAIIGIESDYRVKLGPNSAGACGLTQVTGSGGYPDFLTTLIGSSKEARDYRAAFPRLVSGMDYTFGSMLHHVEARNLLGFYSDIYAKLKAETDTLDEQARQLRKQKRGSEADQAEAQLKERNHFMSRVNTVRNFLNAQIDYLSPQFNMSTHKTKKKRFATSNFDLDGLMKQMVKEFPGFAQANNVQYSEGHDWLADMDILKNLKSTWLASRFQPVYNTFMGAFVYNLDDFRVNNHPYVIRHNLSAYARRSLVQRAYNAGWSRVNSSLDQSRMPKVSSEYVDRHAQRNGVYQKGHKLLYDPVKGIHAATTHIGEGQLPSILHNYPGRNFYTTDLRRLVHPNAAQRNYK